MLGTVTQILIFQTFTKFLNPFFWQLVKGKDLVFYNKWLTEYVSLLEGECSTTVVNKSSCSLFWKYKQLAHLTL